jgi:hypothetical protein
MNQVVTSWDEFEVGPEVVDENEARREAWFALRSGKLTCSHFSDLVKPGRAKDDDFTATGYSYLRMKIAERFGSWHSISGAALSWGTDNEIAAIVAYGMRTQQNVSQNEYGFVEYNSDIGGTPDALCGDDGCLEVKCPYNPAVHVQTLLNNTIPDNYLWQVIGHLLVTGRDWCDFCSFDPRMEDPHRLVIIRHQRNESEIEFLKQRLELAMAWIAERMEKLST